MSKKMIRLDLGCGNRKRAGTIGLDTNRNTAADVVHDLNEFPYPFKPSSVAEVFIDNTLEHLDNPVGVMEEVYRICCDGAVVHIFVPYFRSRYAFIDPTHKHFFTIDSFSYFDPDHSFSKLYNYSRARFGLDALVFNGRIRTRVLRSFVRWIANRWPQQYEYYLSHLIPLDELYFQLKVIK